MSLSESSTAVVAKPKRLRKKSVTMATRAGLVVAPSYMRRLARVHMPGHVRISPAASVFLSSVVQSLLTDLLEVAVPHAQKDRVSRVRAADLTRGIQLTPGLNELYGQWLCVPHVKKMMLSNPRERIVQPTSRSR